jgi:hypothetical protein
MYSLISYYFLLQSLSCLPVSPAYGCIKSALVKCSNEGGLGPGFNMKGDHGSSIFSMLKVDGVLSESFDLF